MKTANPFQIPSCLQADFQRRRQLRFKKIVVVLVIAGASGLVALLIAGCMSERSRSMATNTPVITQVQPAKEKTLSPQPASTFSLNPVATKTPPVAPVTPKQSAHPGTDDLQNVYVVKPGDTLTKIARLYKTTVKKLKEINGLDTDMIVVGAKLKLPPA